MTDEYEALLICLAVAFKLLSISHPIHERPEEVRLGPGTATADDDLRVLF